MVVVLRGSESVFFDGQQPTVSLIPTTGRQKTGSSQRFELSVLGLPVVGVSLTVGCRLRRQMRGNDSLCNAATTRCSRGAPTFARMQPYRKLAVWRFAHELAMDVRRLTLGMPRTGNIELIDQIRRASQSIPANIAEGCGRQTNRDLAKFLQIAIGSSTELEYHLQFCADADIADEVECDARIADVVRVRKMLVGLIKKVRESDGRSVAVDSKPTTGS